MYRHKTEQFCWTHGWGCSEKFHIDHVTPDWQFFPYNFIGAKETTEPGRYKDKAELTFYQLCNETKQNRRTNTYNGKVKKMSYTLDDNNVVKPGFSYKTLSMHVVCGCSRTFHKVFHQRCRLSVTEAKFLPLISFLAVSIFTLNPSHRNYIIS